MAPRGDLAFEAFAHPTRRAILALLADRGESASGKIAAELDTVGPNAVSAQLRVLRTAGLVTERREGRCHLYTLEPDAPDGVVDFLAALYRPLLDLKRYKQQPNRARRDGGARIR